MTMKDNRGFTLVEILVAGTMLIFIVAAGMAVFSGGISSATKGKRHGSMTSYAQMALLAIAADIRCAVEHDDFWMKSLNARHDDGDGDTIDFVMALPNPERKEPEVGGRSEIGYYIDNDPETEVRWLLRREDRTPDDDLLEGGVVSLVGPYVAELDLEFYDGLLWQSGWEGEVGFPRAVRVGIVVVDEYEIERPKHFTTTVPIMAH